MPTTTISVQEVQSRLDELVRQDLSFSEIAKAALDIGTEFLSVDYGYLTAIEMQSDYWNPMLTSTTADDLFSGPLPDLSDTYCRQTIADSEQVALHDAPNQGFATDPAFQNSGYHCYLGTPLIIDGEQYGTVCFVASDPRDEPFTDCELLVANCITRFLGYELDSAQTDQQLQTHQNLTTVLNRILRHNLRNNMTVIRGCATHICDQLTDDHLAENKYRDQLFENIDQLLELGNKARELESIFDESAPPQPTEIESLVEYATEKIATEYDSFSIDIKTDEPVSVHVRPSFETALVELLENAVKHSGEHPRVTVRIDYSSHSTTIVISDDGPGLPKQEQAVLTNKVETPLVHGSGLGIWLAYWIVTAHGGDLESTVTKEGTRMAISLPNYVTEPDDKESSDDLIELMRSRDQYRAAFEESTEAMVIADDDGKIIDANAAASRVYNVVEKDSLLGRSIPEFLPASFDFDTVWSTFRTNGTVRDSLTLTSDKGYEQTYEYIGTADIVPGQHLLIVHDITARVRREAELRMKTRAMDKAPVGITISNPDMEDNPLVYVNDHFCELSGYDESELLGENCRFMQGVSTDTETVDEIRQLIVDESVGSVTLRNYRKDGRMFWNHFTLAPVHNDAGELMNYVGFQQDFSELIKRETKIDKLQKNLRIWRNTR